MPTRAAAPLLVRKVVVGAGWYAVAPLRRLLTGVARGGGRRARAPGAPRSVTFLLSSAWGVGGTIRAVLNLAGHLAAHGYDVLVITTYRRREQAFFGDFPAGVTVVALDDQRPGGARRAGRAPAARALGRVPSVLMHPADPLSRNASLWTDVCLVRLLRRRDGYLIGTRPAFNLIAAAMSGRRLFAVGQEHLHMRAHGRALRGAIRRRYPRLDCLGVLTEQDRRDYEALLRGRTRVVCIPNAVSDVYRTCVPDLSARSVIAAGRVARQKGFDLLVAAFADVAGTHPEWSLRIYGAAGDQRRAIAAQVRRTGLGDRIVLAPPADRLDREMATASIFALSSRWEGFPLTLLEAMSAGLAVVAYDCPTGPRDLIAHGVNGLLVNAADVDALAAALHRLIEDPELRASCAAQARQTVHRYRLEAVGREWDDTLRRLATPRPEPRGASG
jgi:glycosyltransferase involved in cell wall biosynthesis